MNNKNKQARVGACVIIIKDNRVLLGRRNKDPKKASSLLQGEGTWTLPGGKLDFREDVLDCAAREAYEEAGIKINKEKLKLVQNLLKDFNIESRIDEKYKELVISRKENLIKFRDKINFSKGICINPKRKNSIWKKKLEKRQILDKVINSYKD